MKRKRCTTCGSRRLLKFFCRYVHAPDGLSYKCKPCQKEYFRKHHLRILFVTLFRRFSKDREFFENMLLRQKGLCASCEKTPVQFATGREGLHVDHCHKSNKVRGLLCSGCNLMIGHAEEDPARLLGGVAYLERCR